MRRFILLLMMSGGISLAEEQPAESLFPMKKDGKYGYINVEGVYRIEPQFDYAHPFSDNLALVRRDKVQSFIDASGKVVFDSPCPRDVLSFTGGFARGSIGLGFHYFDRTGKLLPQRFADTGSFCEGRAAVYIDPSRFIPNRKHSWVNTGRWGFIDETGELVIPAKYVAVGHFSHGLAPIYVGGVAPTDTPLHGGKWAFIDRDGKVVIEPQFDDAAPFSDGLAKVSTHHKTERGTESFTGYIDVSGNYAFEPRDFFYATSFHEGLAQVREPKVGKGRSFIDKSGAVVLKGLLGSVDHFSEGLAAKRQDPTWDAEKGEWIEGPYGFIDKTGSWVVEPQYDWAQAFRDGLARVGIRKVGQGYIDKSVKRVAWEPE